MPAAKSDIRPALAASYGAMVVEIGHTPSPQRRRPASKLLRWAAAAGALAVVGVAVAVLVRSSAPVSREASRDPVGSAATLVVDETRLAHTAEYQLVLSDAQFSSRDTGVRDFNSFVEGVTGFGLLSGPPTEEDIHYQFHYNLSPCVDAESEAGSFLELRQRNVYAGTNQGRASLDLKFATDSKTDALAFDVSPSAAHAAGSADKLEKDIHPCHSRYSHAGKVWDAVTVEGVVGRCEDVISIFPGAFPGIQPDRLGRTLTHSTAHVIWQAMWQGVDSYGMTYRITYTFRYNTVDDAASGSNLVPGQGEFSMRAWAPQGVTDCTGGSPMRERVEGWYRKIVEEYGFGKDVACEPWQGAAVEGA